MHPIQFWQSQLQPPKCLPGQGGSPFCAFNKKPETSRFTMMPTYMVNNFGHWPLFLNNDHDFNLSLAADIMYTPNVNTHSSPGGVIVVAASCVHSWLFRSVTICTDKNTDISNLFSCLADSHPIQTMPHSPAPPQPVTILQKGLSLFLVDWWVHYLLSVCPWFSTKK